MGIGKWLAVVGLDWRRWWARLTFLVGEVVGSASAKTTAEAWLSSVLGPMATAPASCTAAATAPPAGADCESSSGADCDPAKRADLGLGLPRPRFFLGLVTSVRPLSPAVTALG